MKLLSYIVLFFTLSCYSQDKSSIQFIENKGQFSKLIDYKLSIKNGDLFFSKNKITFNLYNKSKIYDLRHKKDNNGSNLISGHVYNVEFINANKKTIKGLDTNSNYNNYFLGNDKSKWASGVKIFKRIYYSSLYNNIDLTYYEHFGKLKYDFIVHPNGKTKDIKLQYNGADKIKIVKNHLYIYTSMGKVIEQSPYAYQIINNKKTKVNCKYVLNNNILSFKFPKGYNENLDLIIDPILIFATYTGSVADNWGYTATFDDLGNMYVGGTAFAIGYPTTKIGRAHV